MMPKAHELVEDFDDNAPDSTRWWVFGDAREVNRRLECWQSSSAANTYAGYTARATYDLRSSMIWVELVRAPRMGQARLRGYLSEGNELSIGLVDGLLRCEQQSGAAYLVFLTMPYDAETHRWLRLRERNGTIFWEVAADGRAWTVLYSAPAPFSVTAISPGIFTGTYQAVPSPGVAIFDNLNVAPHSRSSRVEERRRSVRRLRERAAELEAALRYEEHANNNDEVNYPTRPLVGSYSKGLPHDALGDPDPAGYGTLLRALGSEDPADFEEIRLSSTSAVKLVNPQAGLAFDLAGPDAQALTMPPAPRFDSKQTAHEAGELYWMALARDIPFSQWAAQATALSSNPIKDAIASLNSEFPEFGGTAPVTVQNLFRGIYPGEQVGPYVSQFLLKGNQDPRRTTTPGPGAQEGYITYGSQFILQRHLVHRSGVDYLTSFNDWLAVQNGADRRGQDQYDLNEYFIHHLRSGATFVHFDQVLNAFYNAAFLLISEPTGNQNTSASGRPMFDLEFPYDQGNPYDPAGTLNDSRTQSGFGTFGSIHLLQVLSEVLGRAIRAVWWQKWGVHRRLRPEEYGGRVHNHLTGARTYPLHSSILTSLQSGALSPYYFGNSLEDFPDSYLLPQAYPEGAPLHPAYGAGHAAGAGACATVLKAFFDESAAIENPAESYQSGSYLVSYNGADAAQMTVGGELNKLAGNIALFRNGAGVHWRSDYTESLPFGEAVAIRLLQEMSLGFNEDDAFFELTRFNGQRIRIFNGKVEPVVV